MFQVKSNIITRIKGASACEGFGVSHFALTFSLYV